MPDDLLTQLWALRDAVTESVRGEMFISWGIDRYTDDGWQWEIEVNVLDADRSVFVNGKTLNEAVASAHAHVFRAAVSGPSATRAAEATPNVVVGPENDRGWPSPPTRLT